jgi:outer membrane protein OmpA-like peptidoglycan-associated protein
MDRAAIDALFGDALSVQPRAPAHYLLHFEKDLLLDAESSALLQAILADIREHGSKDVSVVGHTDTVGSAEYNLALSRRRADFVREFLVRGGVDPAFVRSSSHGKENPLVRTGDNVSERRNRRVEVVVR